MKIEIVHTVLFALSLMLLSACSSSNNVQTSHTRTELDSLGTWVSELDETIWSVFQDQQGAYWLGSKNNGVFVYNGKRLKHYTEKDGLANNEVRGIQEDHLGNIYIQTLEGISKFDGQRFETLKIKEGSAHTNEWVLHPNDLWFSIGFDNKGPYRYDGEYLYYLEFPDAPYATEIYAQRPNMSFSPYGVYKIYKDAQGHMWFGTSAMGLCRFDGQSIRWHYEEQLQKTAGGGDFGTRSILQDQDGLFWINNSRYRYSIASQDSLKQDQLAYAKAEGVGYVDENGQIDFPFFLSATVDAAGDIWMVTYSDGVWRYNGQELIHYPVKSDGKEVLLFSIYKDRQGTLWLGTHNDGVYRYNGQGFEVFELF